MTKKDIGIYPWVENEEEKGDTHQILFKAELQKKGYHVKKLIYKRASQFLTRLISRLMC